MCDLQPVYLEEISEDFEDSGIVQKEKKRKNERGRSKNKSKRKARFVFSSLGPQE